MSALPSYLDRDGFAKYFPIMRDGSDVLTTYILTDRQRRRAGISRSRRSSG